MTEVKVVSSEDKRFIQACSSIHGVLCWNPLELAETTDTGNTTLSLGSELCSLPLEGHLSPTEAISAHPWHPQALEGLFSSPKIILCCCFFLLVFFFYAFKWH